jgi:hypothetical protein
MIDRETQEIDVWRTAYEGSMRMGHSTETARSYGEAALEAFRAAFPNSPEPEAEKPERARKSK